jgi:hypothetical protein
MAGAGRHDDTATAVRLNLSAVCCSLYRALPGLTYIPLRKRTPIVRQVVARHVLRHEIQWAPLDLIEDAAKILADDAERNELGAPHEQHDDHQAGIARHRVAEQQRADQELQQEYRCTNPDDQSEIGGDTQRHRRKAGNAFKRKIPKLPVIPGAG